VGSLGEAHTTLRAVAPAAASAPRSEELERVLRLLSTATGSPACMLVLFEDAGTTLLAAHGLAARPAEQIALPSQLADPLAQTGEELLLSDVRLQPHLAEEAFVRELGLVSCAAVPLPASSRSRGALLAIDRRPREWTEVDVGMLRDLAAAAACELELVRVSSERDELRQALFDREEQLRLAFDAIDLGMLMVSLAPGSAGRIVRVNGAFCSFLGRSEAALVGAHILDITHPDDHERSADALEALCSGRASILRHLEKRYLHADGHTVWGALTTSAAAQLGGVRPHVISLVEDITERKRADLDLPAIGSVLRRILSGEDARETIVQAAVDIAGASSAHLAERAGPDALIVTASVGFDLDGFEVRLDTASATAHAYLAGEARFVAEAAGDPLVSRRLLELSGARSVMWQPIRSHDEVLGVLVVGWAERVRDISARAARAVALLTDETAVALAHRDALERLAAQATTDGLTELPNRRSWEERLRQQAGRSRRAGTSVTVALLDLDRFKDYNDSRGHAAGDSLLREFAERAVLVLREGDTLARWGGEEFALLLAGCPSAEHAWPILERIRSAVPDGQTCSVGFARWDLRESPQQAMRRADSALYRAKALGRDRIVHAEESS
jgi:diguanylate cyclase (GGDEF)-like protein/PAS domain S-box-containing protein